MRTIWIAVALCVSLSLEGCWAVQREQVAQSIDNDGSFKLCLLDHGIDPLQVSACIRTSPGVTDAASTWSCVPTGKKEEFQRCQAASQAGVHVVNCQPNLAGGSTCVTK
jgi:hypothetical protein